MSALLWLVSPPPPIVRDGRKIINIGFREYVRPATKQTLEEKNRKAREKRARIKAERALCR